MMRANVFEAIYCSIMIGCCFCKKSNDDEHLIFGKRRCSLNFSSYSVTKPRSGWVSSIYDINIEKKMEIFSIGLII